MIDISVIIPCYNVEEYVEECLDSVFNQNTDFQIEVIVIDNDSKDNTLCKLNEIQNQKYPTLIILSESKKGAPAARNKGLKIAKGRWIQFLDADDILLDNKLQHQYGIALQNETANFIAGSCIIQNTKKQTYVLSPNNEPTSLNVFINSAGNTCANLFNLKYLRKVGFWNENLTSSQETDLMLRMLLVNDLYVVDLKPNTVVRERESGQISKSDPKLRWKNFFDVRLNFFIKMDKKSLSKPEIDYFRSYLLSILIIYSSFKKLNIKEYIIYLPKRTQIKKIGGISNMTKLLIILMGYKLFFFLRRSIKN